ncbi:MAG: FAD-dependent oxidoreductase, partial [Planctomycetota bacterium]
MLPEVDLERCSIAIIGAGAAGLSTAAALASRGVEGVLVLEAEDAPARHASGLNAAILRTVIDEPAVAALAERSCAFFASPPDGFCDGPLVRSVGLVLTADTDQAAARLDASVERSARAVQRLSRDDLRARVPHLATEARTAWFAREDGVLDIAALTDGFERQARAGGVRIRYGARVQELDLRGSTGAELRLASGARVRCEQLVLAAGGWAASLGRQAGSSVRLEPRRRHLLVTAADRRVDRSWPVVWNAGDAFYARPESGGLLLCACDEATVDADDCPVDPDVRERIAAVTARHLPAFEDAAAAHLWCGMRTFADDHGFVLGPDPHVPALFWVAGLGGHGM